MLFMECLLYLMRCGMRYQTMNNMYTNISFDSSHIAGILSQVKAGINSLSGESWHSLCDSSQSAFCSSDFCLT